MQTFSDADGVLKGNGVPRVIAVITMKSDRKTQYSLSCVNSARETGIRQAAGGSGGCMCRQGLAEVSLASVGSVGCRGVALLCSCVAAMMAGDAHFCCSLTRGKRRAISLRLVGATA
eukprot:scaffold35605_cov41-Cyclotella_meneghiniana.AAC.8